MIIKVDKILLDSWLAAGMIGGVTIIVLSPAAHPKRTSAIIIWITITAKLTPMMLNGFPLQTTAGVGSGLVHASRSPQSSDEQETTVHARRIWDRRRMGRHGGFAIQAGIGP